MKRTTIVLSDELAALLERERRRRDVPATTIVHEALESYLMPASTASQRLPFIGIGQSGSRRRIGRQAEDILVREWAGDDLAGSRSR